MFSNKPTKKDPKKAARKNRAAEVANTFEWLITAFILAFVFRAFVMEAFRIPTGSMADTLMGAHFRIRCPQCGYEYNHGFIPERYGLPKDTIAHGSVRVPRSRCPNCGYCPPTGNAMPVANGDRILVLKCIYQFFEPKQWDVIVFKNPLEPTINYIKRLIGRPGETVEIIDGDIYINGQISRKPHKVQNELWMPVYNNDYQPVEPREPVFNGHTWRQPFKNIADSKWKLADSPTKFRLDSPADRVNSLFYDTSVGNDFRATYAYNDVRKRTSMPYCSDLMVRFYADSSNPRGVVGIALSKYQSSYKAWVDSAGDMVIARASQGKEYVELVRKTIGTKIANRPVLVKFANVDHRLIFQFGDEKLTYDLGRLPEDAGARKTNIEPQVKIFGSGKLTLSHVAIFRDIHYLSNEFSNGVVSCRAGEGNPLTLGEDEFFVLGDNSPNSADGRLWSEAGKGNNGITYRKGIVPRDYLVGKALFVYWPSGFKPFSGFRFSIIPNIGRMRFIYGGTNEKL
ncbi:MAG: signal peptidase I [Planctomycetota bacterium]|nr:MAG: signal peptidase I [Planctomycetota bacterium]